jgi:hypothetical protein
VISTERLGAIPFFSEVPADVRASWLKNWLRNLSPRAKRSFLRGKKATPSFSSPKGEWRFKNSGQEKGERQNSFGFGARRFFRRNGAFGKSSSLGLGGRSGAHGAFVPARGDLRAWVSADAKVPLRLLLAFVQSLNARLRQSTREMILLFDVGGVLAQNLDAPALATQLVEVLTRGFDDPVSRLFLFVERIFRRIRTPWRRGARGWERPVASRPTRTPCSIGWRKMGNAFFPRIGPPIPVLTTPTDPLWPRFKSLLAAPVMGERRPIGHVVFGHEGEEGYFTPTQRRVLAGVVNLVAPAFENASVRLEKSPKTVSPGPGKVPSIIRSMGKRFSFRKAALEAARAADDKKSIDIKLYDVRHGHPPCGLYLVATVESAPHASAVQDEIDQSSALVMGRGRPPVRRRPSRELACHRLRRVGRASDERIRFALFF